VSAAQAALAVVVVGGVVAAALLLRSDGGLWGRGSGPLGGHAVVVLVLTGAWCVAGLVLNSRYQGQVGWDQNLGAVEQRLSDVVRHALILLPFAVPLLVLVLHRFGSTDTADAGDGLELGTPPSMPTGSSHPAARHGSDAGSGGVQGSTLLGIAVVIVIVVVVVVAAVFLWRLLHRTDAQHTPATYATADDEQQRLAEAVDSGRRALLDGHDARAAVIACYLAMEESLAASGVARRVSDSPRDLLERAVASGLTGDGTAALTELFREARYSTHPMDDSHRDRAAAALAEIARRLEARRTAEAAT